uniref:GB1/RHD3-type G domain-containing protein n=1 Tax=Physcomitrium patens TaxID=3218 RepID=A0A2K1IGK4_PHYPA|nr:hypothetical protein PHYPA_028998 [Physcomitrium patens]
MWSMSIKRTVADGNENNLILLDSEDISSYDQSPWCFEHSTVVWTAIPSYIRKSLCDKMCVIDTKLAQVCMCSIVCIVHCRYSTKIFSLATFLSSMFVYNQVLRA